MLSCRRDGRARRRRTEIALKTEAEKGGARAVAAAEAEAEGAPRAPWTLSGRPLFQQPLEEGAALADVPSNTYARPTTGETPYLVCGASIVHAKQSLAHVAASMQALRDYMAPELGGDGDDDLEGLPRFLVMVWRFQAIFGADQYAIIQVFRRDDDAVAAMDVEGLAAVRDLIATGNLASLELRATLQDASPALQAASYAFGLEEPVQIAKRLACSVFRGQGYLEIDQDVNSSTVATLLRSSILTAAGGTALDTTWSVNTGADGPDAVVPLAALRWYYVDMEEVLVDLDEALNPLVPGWGQPAGADSTGNPLPADMPKDVWMEDLPRYFSTTDSSSALAPEDGNADPLSSVESSDLDDDDGDDLDDEESAPAPAQVAGAVDTSVSRNSYCEVGVSDFRVRGPGYMSGTEVVNRKLKVLSESPLYKIAGAHIYKCKSRLNHAASKIKSLKAVMEQYHEPAGSSEFPMFIVVSWMFKSVWSGEFTSAIHLFRRDDEVIASLSPGTRSSFAAFAQGNEKARTDRLKLLAKVRGGASSVRKTISSLNLERPVLLARRLSTSFYQGANYIEFDHDVSSSTTASILQSTIVKAGATLMIDTAWTVEAKHERELPERIVCGVRWNYINMTRCTIPLDKNYDIVEQPGRRGT